MKTYFLFIFAFALVWAGCGQGNQEAKPDAEGSDSVQKEPESAVALPPPPADNKKKPDDLIGGLFDLGTSLAQTADEVGQEIFGLTAKEQKEIGARLHRKLKAKHGLQQDNTKFARIEKLAAPFQKKMKRKDVALSFHILDLDEVNAFSHVGGHIYFNRGLLKIIESDAELQFVIGHEIAHLELGHCEKLLTYAVRAKGLGDELGGALGAEAAEAIAGLAYQTLSAGYSEEQEFACDKWSYHAMRKAGRTHAQTTAMARKFVEHEKTEPDEKPKDPIDRVAREVDHHFRTHPPAKNRLEALEKLGE